MPWRLGIILIVSVLVACAHVPMDRDGLQAESYQQIPVTYMGPSGERHEVEDYELWVKEIREAGRTLGVCLVPRREGIGYQWGVTVFVDAKATWSYESYPMTGLVPGGASLRRGIDCTVSRPLPDGRLSFGVKFVYWE